MEDPGKRTIAETSGHCWEQQEHQPNFGGRNLGRHLLKHMGITPNSLCGHVIDVTFSIKTSTPWPGSDWLYNPGIRWVAPNGTKWICGPNVWPWLPVGWVGLGFVFAPGHISHKPIKNLANLPFLKAQWSRAVFHWYIIWQQYLFPLLGQST